MHSKGAGLGVGGNSGTVVEGIFHWCWDGCWIMEWQKQMYFSNYVNQGV